MILFAIFGLLFAGFLCGIAYGREHPLVADAIFAPDSDDDEDDPGVVDDDEETTDRDEPACLRTGMLVAARLSRKSHTHGRILGFSLVLLPDGSYVHHVILDTGSTPAAFLPDSLFPTGHDEAPDPNYREPAKDTEWN